MQTTTRDRAMRDMTIEQTEEEILTHEVRDEALESAAGTESEKVAKYTFYYCTALDLCPGP